MKKVLAFDFGASGGRAMLASYDGKTISCEEIHRFPNTPVKVCGTLYWDVLRLFDEIKTAIIKAVRLGGFDSIGIDTWGLDFGIIGKDGQLLQNPVHYRDLRTNGISDEVFRIVCASDIYSSTGIQFMSQNTIYQLYYLFTRKKELMAQAKKILMIPDLFAYFLTGSMVCEYTNASTTSLLNAALRSWDYELCEKLGIDITILPEIVLPGHSYGTVSEEVALELGCGQVPVYSVATHDTASAVLSIPTQEDSFMYLSCGTWSLLGTELGACCITNEARSENFTNEGGVDSTIRFLKNIAGLWLIQESKRSFALTDPTVSYAALEQEARQVPQFISFINPDSPDFQHPGDMPKAIQDYCRRTNQYVPQTRGEIARVIYDSLSLKYRFVIERLEKITGKKYSVLNMVGGGIKDTFLCRLTADCCNIKVIAGPTEATSMGNIAMQLIASGEIPSIKQARKIIANSSILTSYEPVHTEAWDFAYTKFIKIINKENINE